MGVAADEERRQPPSSSSPSAAAAASEENQSAGAIVHWEHLNLGVDDNRTAYFFFSEALGLTFDSMSAALQRGGPYVDWYNVGGQQLHICGQQEPQRFSGRCHMVLPDLKGLVERLDRHAPLLTGTRFHVEQSSSTLPAFVDVTCPWGNSFRVWESGDSALAGLAVQRAGLVALELACPARSAREIGRFYQQVLGAQVLGSAPLALGGSTRNGAGGESCAIKLGAGPLLIFHECEDEAMIDQGEWHIAIYTAEFESSFRAVERYSELDNEHPFSDKCYSFQDALLNKQFRIKDVHGIDESGASTGVKTVLRHEVRSLYHPRFNTILANKPSSSL